jgi:hypothetical protein
VRLLAFLAALLVAASAAAQDVTLKKKKKAQTAHKKPTAEQIRKFNELQKKR